LTVVLDRKGIEALIPHRDPFLLIDRVVELEPLVRAVAEHDFTGEEWYLKGHFPGNPIVPGVILTESMAQCVPLDTEILTRRGFKRCDEVKIGDEVLGYDAPSDTCRWTPLRAVSVYERQPTLELSSRSFHAVCTDRHTWAVRLWSKTPEQRRLIQTRDLSDFASHTGNAIVVAAPAESGTHELTPDEAAILGWSSTDGWIEREGEHLRINIIQSKPTHMERIRALVGGSSYEYTRPGGVRTFPGGNTSAYLPSHRFALKAAAGRRLFERAGIHGREDLPALITHLSHEARAAMLEAMLQADAHKRVSPSGRTGRTFVFGQQNPHVLEAFQVLCVLEGRAMGRPQHGPEPGFVRQTVRSNRVADLGHLKVEAGPIADVWCPTTDFGTWISRHNNFVTITGNTATVAAMSHPDYREGLGLFAGIEEMRFKRIVRPGDTARFTAVFEKLRRGFGRARVTTHVGDELAAEGVILALFQPPAKVAP
jgi:3-hydroxymyristoyl/3-hydroxydecanoyl-(acyl carrier protein) dehydratase